MSPNIRRLLALCAAVLVVALGSGCGKKSTKPRIIVPPLTQEQADDMVQQVAMMTSVDHGGWLIDLQSTVQRVPQLAPPGPSLRLRLLAHPTSSSPFGINTIDTTFTAASMTYTFHYFYTDSLGDSTDAWADSVVQIDGNCLATGTIVSDTTFSAFYRHVDDPITGTGLEAGSDTVHFTGVCDDSLFVTFKPTIRGGRVYYATTGFTDFVAPMLRNYSNPWPLSGEATTFLFADALRTPNPDDISGTLEATVRINFNGTPTPPVDVINELESALPKFHYTIDLRTGTFLRAPVVTTTTARKQ